MIITTLSGVSDPFLGQETRYHCPIFVVFKYQKSQTVSFKRQVWKYQHGNYDLLKRKILDTDWDALYNDDIDTYSLNVTNCILDLTKECIPHKIVNIRQSDPPWMHNDLRKLMRQRKRADDKANQTNNQHYWQKYKQLRNKTTNRLRSSKREYFDKMANKLNNNYNITSRDWWKILKSFIVTSKNSSIPPMKNNNEVYTDDEDKANLLNDYFKSQSCLNDNGKEPPQVHKTIPNDLSSIVTSAEEVKSILETLKIGKASGPDSINNYVLKMCAVELSEPLSKLFNCSLSQAKVPITWKEANVTPVFKKDDPIQLLKL